MARCFCCERDIAETRHQGGRYVVDGFRLHTGKTKRVQATTECGENSEHLQLSDPEDFFLCKDCFAKPEITNVWLSTYPDAAQVVALCR